MERISMQSVGKKTFAVQKLQDFQDKNAITEVIGCIINNPNLLKDKKYPLKQDDFVSTFHQLLFSVIHNMVREDSIDIQPEVVDAYLEMNFPIQHKIFTKYNGMNYMEMASRLASQENFPMNYERVRKWSVLRSLIKAGIDVSEYYDPSDATLEENEIKRDRFEEDSLEEMIAHFKSKLIQAINPFNVNVINDFGKAGGKEALDQLELWKETPNFGLSYASQLLTTVSYGLRRKHFTVMSAPSGTGKTRLTVANMCYSFAPYYWNSKTQTWEANQHGTKNSALYIGTEMELLEEIQPIIWAYMADVPESHITQNDYEPGEEERVRQAIEYLRQKDDKGNELQNCGIYLAYVPEYDIATLESIIEEYVSVHNVSAVFFDYIHSTPQLLAEYSQHSRGNYAMREDQALANLSTKLKELTRKYNISIDTCTQVSGDYKNTENYDETIVRGAKSIIDKCDMGMVFTTVSERERTKLEPLTSRGGKIGQPLPNRCITVYKNRGGLSKIRIWLYIDFGTMRVHDLFVTDKDYELISDIQKTRVVVDQDGEKHLFTDIDKMEEYKKQLASRKKEIETAPSEEELIEQLQDDKEDFDIMGDINY